MSKNEIESQPQTPPSLKKVSMTLNTQTGWNRLIKDIIRPPRSRYKQSDLGSKSFKFNHTRYSRQDIVITHDNKSITLTIYQPQKKYQWLILYLHGNSSWRMQATGIFKYLPSNFSLAAFDFIGCGLNQEADCITLGHTEAEQVTTVVRYLEGKGFNIILWGRSMGAATALKYGKARIIVADSSFKSFKSLCRQVVSRYAPKYVPDCIVSCAFPCFFYKLRQDVKEKGGYDVQLLDILHAVQNISQDSLIIFMSGDEDTLIDKVNSEKLYARFRGKNKHLEIFEGTHNTKRPEVTLRKIMKKIQEYVQTCDLSERNLYPRRKQRQKLMSELDILIVFSPILDLYDHQFLVTKSGHTYIDYLNTFSMKLVLKHNSTLKLYTQQLDFKLLLTFIQKQLNLQPESINMAFTDDEGDEIVIGSDEDLHVMENLTENKSYVKICVKGMEKEKEEVNYINEDKDKFSKDDIPFKKQKIKKQDLVKKQSKPQLGENKKSNVKEEKKVPQLKQKKFSKQKTTKIEQIEENDGKPGSNFATFSKLMTQAITTLVDQRIRVLIPRIKEQSQAQCQKIEQSQIQDPNTQKRFKTIIKKLYNNFFNPRLCSIVKQNKKDNEKIIRHCKDLKLMFGGKIEDYKLLVQQNIGVKLINLVEKYCQINQNISKDHGYKRYLDIICVKLGKRFNNDSVSFFNFVKENRHLEYQGLMKLYSQQLKQKEQEKAIMKVEEIVKQPQKETNQPIKKMKSLNIPVRGSKEAIINNPLILQKQEKKCPGSHLEPVKRKIYDQLIELFGDENAEKYPKFIENNYFQGRDNINMITQLWLDYSSVIGKL